MTIWDDFDKADKERPSRFFNLKNDGDEAEVVLLLDTARHGYHKDYEQATADTGTERIAMCIYHDGALKQFEQGVLFIKALKDLKGKISDWEGTVIRLQRIGERKQTRWIIKPLRKVNDIELAKIARRDEFEVEAAWLGDDVQRPAAAVGFGDDDTRF